MSVTTYTSVTIQERESSCTILPDDGGKIPFIKGTITPVLSNTDDVITFITASNFGQQRVKQINSDTVVTLIDKNGAVTNPATVVDVHTELVEKNFFFDTSITDINDRLTELENAEIQITIYRVLETQGGATAGTISFPAGSVLNEEAFQEYSNCVLSEINAQEAPTYENPTDGSGNIIDSTLDSSGNWTITSAVTSDIAIIFRVNTTLTEYGDWIDSDLDSVLDAIVFGQVTSVNGEVGAVVLTTTEIPEGTNLYYTEARVTANPSVTANTTKVSANGSINTHNDVDTSTNAPTTGQYLNWDGTNWVPVTLKDEGYLDSANNFRVGQTTEGLIVNAASEETYLELTFTPIISGSYKLECSFDYSIDTTTSDFIGNVDVRRTTDDVVIGVLTTIRKEPQDSGQGGIILDVLAGGVISGTDTTGTDQIDNRASWWQGDLVQGTEYSLQLRWQPSAGGVEATIHRGRVRYEFKQ